MTAEGKITTTAITRQAGTKPGVRILVTQDPTTGALDYTYRKTGAVAVLVTGFTAVAGSRQVRYQLQTSAGTITCAPSQTHWLARDKDKDALPAIAFDACSQCSAGHAGKDGRCERHGKRIAAEPTATVVAESDPEPLTVDQVAEIWEGKPSVEARTEAPPTECARCKTRVESMHGHWFTKGGTDFMCPDGEEPHSPDVAAGTYEHQISDNGGKTWRTVAVGLEASDVYAHRAANEAGEGATWRMLPEGDDKARAIAAKAAELFAARTRFHANAERAIGGRSRTKQFGRRVDGQLKRAGELNRLVERLSAELDALRRPVREVPPLDLERLPHATHVRTDVGWYKIVKVNRKSVKVEVDPGWDDLIPIKRIKEIHERPTQTTPAPTKVAAELAEVEATRDEIPPGSRRPPVRAQAASDRHAATLRRQLDDEYRSPWETV
jgi:hypothetical protein